MVPDLAFQLWSVYSWDHHVYDNAAGQYEPVHDRWNMQLRRARIGFKGQFSDRLNYRLSAAIDGVGHDRYAATYGPVNNGANPSLRLWYGFLTWKLLEGSDALHLTAGYFSPRFGRENITSPFNSPSMEKAWSQNYIRRHLTGYGHGRAVSINIGGQFYRSDRLINFYYDIGFSTPQQVGVLEPDSKRSVLLTGRIAFNIGDPESTKYILGHRVDYFRGRRGFTLALSGSLQGAQESFEQSTGLAIDWLFNWDGFHLDGETALLARENVLSAEHGSAWTGYLRVGYDISIGTKMLLEPVVLFTTFQGASDNEEQELALSVGLDSGSDNLIDVGINLHLNPQMMLMLHVNFLSGSLGSADQGAVINNYFRKVGTGIQRGNWAGLGFVIAI